MILNFDGENDKVREQIVLLLSTRVGEQALDRDYGIDTASLDMPTEAAKAIFAADVIEKVKKYVKGASVKSVNFEVGDGKLNPKVVIKIE